MKRNAKTPKPLRFVKAALKDLKSLPAEVQDEIGFALSEVEFGRTPHNAKPLHGFGGGVWEIVDDFQTDTYRAVYIVRYEDVIYVLHCFQKKSKRGIELPKADREVIEQRLKDIEATRRK